jgi:hypothetical protein
MLEILNTIDPNSVVEEVRSIAAKNPDHIYTDKDTSNPNSSCFYERNGKPSCIMGQALFNLGVPIETLSAMDRQTGGIFSFLLTDGVSLRKESNTLYWLCTVQNLQDNLYAWGVAVATADTEFPGV